MNEEDKAEALINSKMPQLAGGFEQEVLDGDFILENKINFYACGKVPELKVVVIEGSRYMSGFGNCH